VAVIGSPRPQGNTAYVVDLVLDELRRRGAACEKVVLADYRIAGCEGHDDCADLPVCAIDDDAQAVHDKVYAADGLVLASPVYFEDVSAQMKAWIDRNQFQYEHERRLRAKVVGLVAVAAETGLDDTLATLQRYVALCAEEGAEPEVFTASGYAEGLGTAAGNEELAAAAARLAADMGKHLF
jgi:multimeric flavodoxin WrbA